VAEPSFRVPTGCLRAATSASPIGNNLSHIFFIKSKSFIRLSLSMVLLLGLSGCTPTLTPSNKTSDPTKQPNIPLTPNSPLPFTPDPNLTSLAQIIATQNVVSVTPAEPAEITLATPTIVVTATPNAQNTPMPVTPLPALATFAQNLPTTFQARLLNQLEMA